MSLQALPRRRVASPPLIPAAKMSWLPAAPLRLWPNLSAETQTQIARILADSLRRMQPTTSRRQGRGLVLIAAKAADERITTVHRAKEACAWENL